MSSIMDGMTRDAKETVKLMQGPITRMKAKRIEEESKGEVTLFGRMLQDLAWHVLEEQLEDSRGSKTFLLLRAQIEESKERDWKDWKLKKKKKTNKRGVFWSLPATVGSTVGGRFHPTVADRPWDTKW